MKSIFEKITWAIAILAFCAATGGLTIPDLYQDADLIKTVWYANDFVTLAIGPLLIAACWNGCRGSARAQLLWLGGLMYIFYNYAFYLFGAAFNKFFLLYASLVTLSLYAIVLAFINIERNGISLHVPVLTRRITSTFLLAIALPLAGVEITECVRFIVNDELPKIPILVLALDLSLAIPNTILAAVLLLKNERWGVILAIMMLGKSVSYGAVLMSGASLIAFRGVGPPDPLLPFYIFMSLGGGFCLWWLMRSFEPARVL